MVNEPSVFEPLKFYCISVRRENLYRTRPLCDRCQMLQQYHRNFLRKTTNNQYDFFHERKETLTTLHHHRSAFDLDTLIPPPFPSPTPSPQISKYMNKILIKNDMRNNTMQLTSLCRSFELRFTKAGECYII